MENEKEKTEKELKELKKLLEIEKKNLIFMLKNINLENINLINFHYKFKDILNKIDYLENKLFYMD